jgi:hypothetical protein
MRTASSGASSIAAKAFARFLSRGWLHIELVGNCERRHLARCDLEIPEVMSQLVA